VLCFIGGYPIKYLLGIIGSGLLALIFFILVAKAFPDAFANRVDTWEGRIENFFNGVDTEADYQIEKAKIAIATGGIVGRGAGKSVQKNFLPQSSSDFIYAIRKRYDFWNVISSGRRLTHNISGIDKYGCSR